MARAQLTSLVTTRPNPKRWWRRAALGALATAFSALVAITIISRGQVSIGAGALLAFGAVAYRLRKTHEPLCEEYGPARYTFREDVATFSPADGRDDIHLGKADLRGVELTASDALVLQRRDGTTVRLGAESRSVLVRIADDLGRGDAILRRVAGGSPVSRLSRTWATGARIAYGIVLLFTFAACSIAGLGIYDRRPDEAEALVAAFVMLSVAGVATLAFRGTEIRVGADGVSYRVLVRRRFLAHARIERLKQGDRGVLLTLVDGREVLLPTTGIATARLLEHIDEGRAATQRATGVGSLGALLDRGSRPLDEWKRTVAALAVNTGGYRATLFTAGQLRRVVEDGGAPPERRVAAAIALRNATGKTRRILIAARASADDALRAALEAAAEGEIEEEALSRATARHLREDGV